MKKINYSGTLSYVLKNYWDEALLIFAFFMLLNYLSFSASDVAREGLLGGISWLGGSALLGWALISLGMAMVPLGSVSGGVLSIIGVIMVVVGGIMVGVSLTVVWVWIKNNLLLAGGIFLVLLVLLRNMSAKKKPVQNIYYVQK